MLANGLTSSAYAQFETNLFDGKATLITGTHTHVPTNDARILKKGSAYITDSGMCGDYDSVIGMNKDNSINKF